MYHRNDTVPTLNFIFKSDMSRLTGTSVYVVTLPMFLLECYLTMFSHIIQKVYVTVIQFISFLVIHTIANYYDLIIMSRIVKLIPRLTPILMCFVG